MMTMRDRRLIYSASIIFLSLFNLMSCAPHDSSASYNFLSLVNREGDTVQLTGWVKVHGEIMLFPDRGAMQANRRFPNCISGVMKNHSDKDFSKLEGKRVSAIGDIYNFEELPNEDVPILSRKVLLDSIISNFCYGKNVILIKDIMKEGS